MVEQRLQVLVPDWRGAIYPAASMDSACQLFYSPIGKNEAYIGVSLNLTAVERTHLVAAAKRMSIPATPYITWIGRGTHVGPDAVPFHRILPFWALSFERWPDDPGSTRALRAFGALAMTVMVLLIMGVFLLIRDNWQQWRLNTERAAFVSAISHDLKTPVTAIGLYADLLASGESTATEIRDFCKVIKQESLQLAAQVDRILSVSRYEHSQARFEMKRGDLAAAIMAAVLPYRHYCASRGIRLTVECPDSLLGVRFDANAVKQAASNLLDNAIKFSDEPGTIHVRLVRRENAAIFCVKDSGVGVAPEEKERIFEKFYRSKRETSTGGYGLGLYLVQIIMSAHGGTVEVDSKQDEGSEFRLVFPYAKDLDR